MLNYLHDFSFVLDRDWSKLPSVLLLVLFSASLDLIGISLVVPLVASLDPHNVVLLRRHLPATLDALVGRLDARQLFGLLGGIIIVVFAAKAVAAYTVQRRITAFAEDRRTHLAERLLSAYLASPLEFHLRADAARMQNAATLLVRTFADSVLSASLRMFADGFMTLSIVALLAVAQPLAVALLVLIMAAVAYGYARLLRRAADRRARRLWSASDASLKIFRQSMGSIKETVVLGVESYFVRRFSEYARIEGNNRAVLSAIQILPRFVIELALVSFLVLFTAIAFATGHSPQELLPVLGMFAFAGLRLLPATNSLMSNWSSVRNNFEVLTRLAAELRETAISPLQPDRNDIEPLMLGEIRFDKVSYLYPATTTAAINELDIILRPGEALGVVGRSGAGKTTLADLLLGLLQPTSGQITMSGQSIALLGRRWRNVLAYIPQDVYLIDSSLRSNIAFGMSDEEIDESRLREACAIAQLDQLLSELPEGIETRLGERGVRLSGGQRQRVAIARALYHKRQLIVMDEATAALDYDTEREVISNIQGLQGRCTLLIIAHRLSTLEACNRVIKLERGRLTESGSYAQVVLQGVQDASLS